MPSSPLHQGLRSLQRDWRAGELRLLTLSIVLAVAALSAVSFFADRIHRGLQRDATALLGGDVVVVSDRETPAWIIERARQEGLRHTVSSQFPTMAQFGPVARTESRLVALKAVAAGYPLRGSVQLQLPLSNQSVPRPSPQKADLPQPASIPGRGEVWVDAALLESLGARVGEPIALGSASLRIAAVIDKEPDRGAGFMNFAPRVMMNELDLPGTRLVQPASRITWRFAVAGPDAGVQSFREFVEQRLKAEADAPQMRGLRIESLESGRPEMRQTLDRAERFLSLVALLTALLSAVAVAIACRGFAQRRLDDCAMQRVLGQSQRSIALCYMTEFAAVGWGASLAGLTLGYAMHHLFMALAQGLIMGLPQTSLPLPGWWPVVLGLGTGTLLTFSFGLPPVLQLSRVPPLRVIRRDLGNFKGTSLGVLTLGVAGFATLLLLTSSDIKPGILAVGGFAAAIALFCLLGWLAVAGLRHMTTDRTAPVIRLAVRQMTARPTWVIVQLSALGVGLLALALLVLLRTDLIQSWRQATPVDAPNRFVINIQPDQATSLQESLQSAGIRHYDWYPMIRGRLIAINGRAVTPERFSEDRAKRLVDREFNLSYADNPPAHNPVTAGRWIRDEEGAVSVEEGLANTLGLKLGDTLTFDVAGMSSQTRISSLRKVDWASMRVNFFVMYTRSAMPAQEPWPITYISAFRAPAVAGFDNTLVRRFPNLTLVNTESTLQQVQDVVGQVIAAVEYLFAFALAAGLLVLLATVSATRTERTREFAIMRALGADSKLLAQVQRIELAGVGLLSGLLAGSLALGIGGLMSRYAFEFDWTPRWWVPLACAAAGSTLALLAGHLALRQVLQAPVIHTLRESSP